MHELQTKIRILFTKLDSQFPDLEKITYWESNARKPEDYKECEKLDVFDKVDEVVTIVDQSLKSDDFSLETLDKLENAVNNAILHVSYLLSELSD